MFFHRWRKPAQRSRKESASASNPRASGNRLLFVEPLERRNLLATLVGVTSSGQLATFDSNNPDTIISTVPINGLQPGEVILASDIRPSTGQLYLLGSSHRLYTMDTGGVEASIVGSFLVPISGTGVGMDFNPVTDQLRVVTEFGENIRLNPNTGAVIDFDPLTPGTQADIDLTPGANVVAIAYSNNTAGSGATTLYGIDSVTNSIVRIGGVGGNPSPNIGTVTTIGSMGVDTTNLASFDIGPDGTAYASLVRPDGAGTQLYRVSLTNGRASFVDDIGAGESIVGLAVTEGGQATTGRFQFSQSTYTANESAGQATITITRTGGTTGAAFVTFMTNGGTATPNVDYIPVTQTIAFNNGESRATVTITILNDAIAEGTETVTFRLSNPSSGTTLGTPSNATLTIIDGTQQAQSQFRFQQATLTVDEGAPASIIVSRTGDSTQPASVQFSTANGTATAGIDYISVNQLLQFNPGETTQTITISTLDDAVPEGDETVRLQLSNPSTGATLGNPSSATLTIRDDSQGTGQSVFRFSQANYSADEGTTATIMVSRTGDTQNPASIMVQTVGGTATPGADYISTGEMLQFNIGETIKSLVITILPDSIIEGSETVIMTLTNPSTGDTIGSPGTATLTIRDTDQGGGGQSQFRFTQTLYVADEGTTTFVTINRTGNTSQTASVTFVTGGGTATPGVDYTPVTQTVVFGFGETLKNVPIAIAGDGIPEGDESVGLQLFSPSPGNSLGAPSTATLTIRDGGGGVPLNPVQSYIQQVYHDLLRRDVDPEALGYWTRYLTSGGSRFGFGFTVANSVEYRVVYIRDLFQKYIGRQPDSVVVGGYLQLLALGGNFDHIQARILGASEYSQRKGGGSNLGYLQAIYADVLGRPVNEFDKAFFRPLFAANLTRQQIALTLLQTREADQLRVTELFRGLLRREPDIGGVSSFTDALQRGARDEQVVASIVASDEYFNRATQSNLLNVGF